MAKNHCTSASSGLASDMLKVKTTHVSRGPCALSVPDISIYVRRLVLFRTTALLFGDGRIFGVLAAAALMSCARSSLDGCCRLA